MHLQPRGNSWVNSHSLASEHFWIPKEEPESFTLSFLPHLLTHSHTRSGKKNGWMDLLLPSFFLVQISEAHLINQLANLLNFMTRTLFSA